MSPNRYIILARDAFDQTIEGFSLDGDAKKVHGGLLVQGSRIVIRNMRVSNFNFNGVFVEQTSDHVHLYNLVFANSSLPDPASCTGNLMFGTISDSEFHHIVITESSESYGIKHFRSDWTDANTARNAPASPVTNVKFYQILIDVPRKGAWGSGQPDIALETWGTKPGNVELYENTFNNTVSLVAKDLGAPLTFNVHHNDFALNYNQYRYALELYGRNARIHHNLFNGGYYPIADTAATASPNTNLAIHHNVFMNMGAVTPQLLNLKRPYDGLKFVNNTVYMSQSVPLVQLYNGVNTNWLIANNIFHNTSSTPADFFTFQSNGSIANPNVRNNLYHHVQIPAGALQSIVGQAPQLQWSGVVPDPFFRPASGSNVIDQGVTVPGLTDGAIGNPDLGAIESGSASWSVGSRVKVFLKSGFTGQLVAADQTQPTAWTLIANRTGVGNWEQFVLICNPDTTVSFQSIPTASNQYVRVNGSLSDMLVANGSTVGNAEKFELFKHADGTVSFKSLHNGKFVSADGATKKLYARKSAADPAVDLTPNEKFELFVP